MAVTQTDVARAAGVAPRTVSNVVNDFPHVSPEVRLRVQDAIRSLGYYPNRAAQRLRTGRSDTVGLMLPELDVGYFGELGRLIVEEGERRGFTLLVTQTLGDAGRELEVLDKFVSQQPRGVVISPLHLTAAQVSEYVPRLAMVLIGEQLHVDGVDHIGIDNEGAARDIVRLLVQRGRRRIAFIGASPDGFLRMPGLRFRGFQRALLEGGLPSDPALLVPVAGYHQRDGYGAAEHLLRSTASFDAAFCATDLLAFGAMRALADHGFDVPGDVSVAGFDDLDQARYSTPRLSTVSPDKAAIAAAAIRRLCGSADEAEHGAALDPSPYRIVDRETI